MLKFLFPKGRRKRWLIWNFMRVTTKYSFLVAWLMVMVTFTVTFPESWNSTMSVILGIECLLLPIPAAMCYLLAYESEQDGFYTTMIEYGDKLMKIKTLTPPPGSAEARALGCRCAVLDNNHGKGFQYTKDGPPCYYVSGDCPVHCEQEDEETDAKADVTP